MQCALILPLARSTAICYVHEKTSPVWMCNAAPTARLEFYPLHQGYISHRSLRYFCSNLFRLHSEANLKLRKSMFWFVDICARKIKFNVIPVLFYVYYYRMKRWYKICKLYCFYNYNKPGKHFWMYLTLFYVATDRCHRNVKYFSYSVY